MTPLSCYPKLLNYCRRLTRDNEAAKDLVQETYEVYYKYNYSGTGILFGIARNRHTNHAKKQEMFDSILNDLISAPVTHDLDLYDAEYHRRRVSSMGVMGDAVNLFIDGYSYKEIADKQNVNINTVKSRIRYAKKRLGVV